MHASLVSVSVEPGSMESARAMLIEQVVPMVASAPGFIAGYWLQPVGDVGLSVLLYETEEQARAAAPPVGPAPAPGPRLRTSSSVRWWPAPDASGGATARLGSARRRNG